MLGKNSDRTIPIAIVVILFSLALALSEDFLAACGTFVQLKCAYLLKCLGLFDGRKKNGEHIRTVVGQQKDEKLYNGEVIGPQLCRILKCSVRYNALFSIV